MLNVRGQNVLLDRDVAMLYGVETRIVNQAVKNNPLKFPEGYIIELDEKGIFGFKIKNFDLRTKGGKRSSF